MRQPSEIARTPQPSYYAVIFTSKRRAGDQGYGAMAERMLALESRYDGFLGIESMRGADGVGITVSHGRDEATILAWKRDEERREAQRGGRGTWYEHYKVRVAKVERAYEFGFNRSS